MAKRFTIMLVPDRSSRVKRVRVSRGTLWFCGGLMLFILVAFVAGTVHYLRFAGKLLENRQLREQNVELRSSLIALYRKVDSAMASLSRIERLETKLRVITQINDPQRHLALGPFEARGGGENIGDSGVVDPLIRAMSGNPVTTLSLVEKRTDELAGEAERREGSLRQVELRLIDQEGLLDSTPSIWPVRGWVTSTFGMRSDPFTGEMAMHRGIDVSNQIGTPVVAPASGLVAFVDGKGSSAFGKEVVIDHGFGKRTRFAHLNEVRVKVGERVERRQVIGTLGNTGRSTGPHLHYEVEINGVVTDPDPFLLDD